LFVYPEEHSDFESNYQYIERVVKFLLWQRGGDLLIEGARKVFEIEFPELLSRIKPHLPDEKIRRVGQSVAAASLPLLDSAGSEEAK
jgi:hypothetical protein